MSIIVVALAIAAFLLLGVGSDGHHRRRIDRSRHPRLRAGSKAAGWILLAAAFPSAIATQGWVFGPVAWAGAAMLGAGVAFLLLNLVPDASRRSDPRPRRTIS